MWYPITMPQKHRTFQAAVLAILAASVCTAQTSLPPASQPAPKAATVYAHDFERPVGGEWSARTVETAPKGRRTFLGQFSNETVALSLDALPPHTFVQVSFDLLLIRTWDGNNEKAGPDIWELGVADGPTLLRTTFSNVDFYAGHKQAFPDWIGRGSHKPRTGAAERDVLGYEYAGPPEIGTRVVDSVYPLTFTFPHAGGAIKLNFSASGLDKDRTETWGLDNVRVAVLNTALALAEGQLAGLWEDLAGEDAERAYAAVWTLIQGGEATVSFLEERLADVMADPKRIAELTADLDHDDWRRREAATEALTKMGKAVEKPLKEHIEKLPEGDHLEARVRIEEVLRRVADMKVAAYDARRYARARQVLRIIRTPKARELLSKLAVEVWAPPEEPKTEPEAPPPVQVIPAGGVIRLKAARQAAGGPFEARVIIRN